MPDGYVYATGASFKDGVSQVITVKYDLEGTGTSWIRFHETTSVSKPRGGAAESSCSDTVVLPKLKPRQPTTKLIAR